MEPELTFETRRAYRDLASGSVWAIVDLHHSQSALSIYIGRTEPLRLGTPSTSKMRVS